MINVIKTKNEEKTSKGITLIALVITIIVLLILAGISIVSITGENGILSKSTIAKEETNKKEYEEILKIIGNGLQPNKIINNWDTKTYLDEFTKEIKKEDKFKESEVNRKNDETINVVTKEKYVYKITENEIKYIGTQGQNPPPDLQESDITFNLIPKEKYTNKDITVEIIVNIELKKYTLQYSTDGSKWTNYEKPILVGQNGPIFARLINELDEIGGNATENITNIDKELPNDATINFSGKITNTAKAITATVSQSDNGVSNVNIKNCMWIYTTQKEEIGTNENEYTGGNFTTNPEDLTLKCENPGAYYLHILTVDNAGNKKESISKQAIIVNEVDKTPPNDAKITLTSTRVDIGNTVTATVEVSDDQSGINIENCKYIINNSESKLGINASNWDTASTLSGITSSIPITSTTRGSLYLHILSCDNEENKTETVSNGVYFAQTVSIFSLSYRSGISPR